MVQYSNAKQSRRFLKNSAFFFIGNILSKVVTFLLLPMYTRFISPGDMGYYDLSISYATAATSIIFLDIWVTTMRYMYDHTEREWKEKSIVSGYSIFFMSSVLLIIFGIIIMFSLNIKYIVLLLIYVLIINLLNMLTYQARGFGKTFDFALSGFMNTLITVTINIILIAGLKWDFSALYIAAIAGAVSQIVYLELKIKSIQSLRLKNLDFKLMKQMLLYTLPLSINSVAYWILTSFDKVVINKVLSAEYNGYYAIGYKFGLTITLVTSCFTFAWQDLSFSRDVNDKDNGVYFSKACKLYMLFLSMCVIMLIPTIYMVFPFFVDASYNAAKETIPLFLITVMLNSYSTFMGNIFYALKSSKSIFISTIVSCLVNLLLCYPCILLYGINGANISIAISFLINIIIRNFILKKKIGFTFDNKNFLLLFCGIAISYCFYILGNTAANCVWFIIAAITCSYMLRDQFGAVITSLIKPRKEQ